MPRYRFLMVTSLVVALTLLLPPRASATLFQFDAVLDGAQELPPTATSAFGYASLGLDDVRNEFFWGIYYQDLTTPATAAHFHAGPPGALGPMVLPIPGASGLSGLLLGSAIVTPDFVAQLLGGDIYISVHSERYPAGEIRGQVTLTPWPVPEPTTIVLLATGLMAMSCRRYLRERRRGRLSEIDEASRMRR